MNNKLEPMSSLGFGSAYAVTVRGVDIFDMSGERVGVLAEEFDDLVAAYTEKSNKANEYKELLIENGLIEREYTKEELDEIQREADRQSIKNLTELVEKLVESSERDKEAIKDLKSQLGKERSLNDKGQNVAKRNEKTKHVGDTINNEQSS